MLKQPSAKALGTLKGSRYYRVMLVTTPLKRKDIFTHSFNTSAYVCAPQVCRWPQETEEDIRSPGVIGGHELPCGH